MLDENLENSMFSHISASNTAVCRGQKTGKDKNDRYAAKKIWLGWAGFHDPKAWVQSVSVPAAAELFFPL